MEFWTELGQRMGYDEYFPWKSAEEVVSHLLEPSGVPLEKLHENSSGIFYDIRAMESFNFARMTIEPLGVSIFII